MRSTHLSLGLSALLSLVLCAVPLFGVQGAESALALGVVLPAFAAYSCARLSQRQRQDGAALGTLTARALLHALLLWLVPVLILGLDALRVRNCAPLEGLAFMGLGPAFGIALAALVGIALALALPGGRAVALLAAAIPVATMLRAIIGFYTGPAIFAYGHFFGFFPGTLYDAGITITTPLLWLRVFTTAQLAALGLLIASCIDPTAVRPTLPTAPGRRLMLGLALAAGLFAVAAELNSDALGHSTSRAHIRAALGGKVASARCDIYLPREWPQRDRARLGRDCDFRVQRAEHWLRLTHPGRISVYLFRSAAEKYALMGAANTDIAKPWLSEVYISDSGWPNPVLGHEIVHVVAGAAGSGPFRIAGRWGGLWPNPALIEGVAVAAAWAPQSDLTPHEWAHAMLELDMVPPLSTLFGAGFLAQQRGLAYTLSGSLLRFVHERWGARAIARTYATGSLERGLSMPLGKIEAAWRSYLQQMPLSDAALALARARFSGSGVLSAVCPHTLAKLRETLRADLSAGDDLNALSTCRRIVDVDETDASARATLASLQARAGNERAVAQQLQALQTQGAPQPFLSSVEQAVADEAYRAGHYTRAARQYAQLLTEPMTDDQRRQVEVKHLATRAAAAAGPDEAGAGALRQAQLLLELLVGDTNRRTDPADAVYLARELRAVRSDGLPFYLEARQLYFAAHYDHAAELLDRARALGLPSPTLAHEALRVLSLCRLALGQLDRAQQLYSEYADSGSAARRAVARDFLARIRFLRHRAAAAIGSQAHVGKPH